MTAHATCDGCGMVRKLTSSGLLVLHFIKTDVGIRNLSRTRKARRACPGSGRPPRRVER